MEYKLLLVETDQCRDNIKVGKQKRKKYQNTIQTAPPSRTANMIAVIIAAPALSPPVILNLFCKTFVVVEFNPALASPSDEPPVY